MSTLMIQGTTSDAGKSTLVTALCRWLKNRGISTAPFKPQNMALNSAVTEDGGEIGRAQAVQARACGLKPHSDMNPVLLKPNSDIGAQVIIQGRALRNMDAAVYHDYKPLARKAVLESYARLSARYQCLLVEGAGSPAEVNLRAHDIANMGFAEAVDCPVILIADIDRGGVFAHIIGTLAVLSPSERARVAGFVINRFRGDIALLEPGLKWLEERTGKPVLGVLPYLQDLQLEAEDTLNTSQTAAAPEGSGPKLNIAVPVTARLSNHTDFDPLRLHPEVSVSFVRKGRSFPPADLIIIGGSKSVRRDLDFLRANGWETAIKRHLRYGGKLVGICGGFQMLGRMIHDPLGVEGEPGSTAGLGLLDMETTLRARKSLRNVEGILLQPGEAAKAGRPDAPSEPEKQICVRGYEIHAGSSRGTALGRPLLSLKHSAAPRPEGAMSEDGQILGTYLHGLFDEPDALAALLAWAGLNSESKTDYRARAEGEMERLAGLVEKHLDTKRILDLLRIGA